MLIMLLSFLFLKTFNFSLKIFGATEREADLEMAALTIDGANVMDGTKMKHGELNISRTESPASSKVVGKKKYRSRSASASSQDSYSSGSYTGKQL